jgi:hypothetical protein
MRCRALMAAFATASITVATAAVVLAPPGATAATPSAAHTPTPPAAPSPTTAPFVVGVAIFPDDQPGLKTAAGTDAYEALAAKLNGLGPFRAWIADAKCKFDSCRLSDARIYIYGKQTTPGGADKPVLTLTSYFAGSAQVQRIDSVPLTIATANGTKTVGDVTQDQLRVLVGHLVLDDQFKIAISLPDSEAALQLVPSPVNATDPDYEPILEHILATFGVPAVRSRLSASAIRGPNDAGTCPGAQRYFIYRVRLEEYPRKLLGHTRLESYAEGFILDCTAPNVVAAATGKGSHDIPTTSTLLTDLSAFVIALYPKATSQQLTLGVNAFSKLVDVDPRSADVRDSVASGSLAQLVNNMCIRLLQQQPSASPSPLSAAETGSPPPTASPWVMPRPSAQPLQCRKPVPYRRQARGPAPANEPYGAIYDQWYHVTPAPKPTDTP